MGCCIKRAKRMWEKEPQPSCVEYSVAFDSDDTSQCCALLSNLDASLSEPLLTDSNFYLQDSVIAAQFEVPL